MNIYNIILGFLIIVTISCSSLTQDITTSNVYQPKTVTTLNCPQIEYEWKTNQGLKRKLFTGVGEFCTKIDFRIGTVVKARCVTINSEGQSVPMGNWVNSIPAETLSDFLKLCPN